MSTGKKIGRLLAWLGVLLLQVISTQVVAFLFSFPLGNMETVPQNQPLAFSLFVWISYTLAIFLSGWLAIKAGWLALAPLPLVRLVGVLAGVAVALIAALLIYHPLEPGNPFFLVAILTGILGFYLPGWFVKKPVVKMVKKPAVRHR